jgi:hypothetical protein
MLKILDSNKFIKDNRCLEVTNPQSFDKNFNPTEDGLYSKKIFGSTKQEQFTKFGYLTLGTKILHPIIYKNISSITGLFKKILAKTTKVTLQNGILVDVGETGSGWNGVKDLYNNWDKIDFSKYDEKNSKVKSLLDYLKTTPRDLIFEDKLLIIPTNFRPAILKNGLMQEDEITGYYKALLFMVDKKSSTESTYLQSLMQVTDKTTIIQEKVNEIYNYFISFLEKKDGLFRSNLIGKRQNNAARLVANAQPTVPMDCIVIPWQTCLNLFDLPIIGMINNDPFQKDYISKLNLKDLSPDDLADLFGFIYHNVEVYTKNNKPLIELWQELILDTFNYHSDIRCLVKRDPAWDKGSYHCLKPIINTDNEFTCIINSMLYNPLGGDSFYTNYTTIETNTNVLTKDEHGELFLPRLQNTYQIKSMHKLYELI